MSDCIFCKIIAGEIPSAKIYEDDTKLVFMDIGPVRPGHILLIPKKHYVLLTDMPGDEIADLASVLPDLGGAVVEATGADGFNVHQANGACSGQVVPHVHIHIIPRNDGDGCSLGWKAGSYAEGEMVRWRDKIAAALEG